MAFNTEYPAEMHQNDDVVLKKNRAEAVGLDPVFLFNARNCDEGICFVGPTCFSKSADSEVGSYRNTCPPLPDYSVNRPA